MHNTKYNIYPHDAASVVYKRHGSRIWNKYFKFAFVRNPYSRLCSYYFYHRSNRYRPGPKHSQGKEIAKINTFKKWAIQGINANIQYKQGTSAVGQGWWSQIPQHYYLDRELDFIGRYENLQNDFDYACEKIGIEPYELPHYNKSEPPYKWKELYDDELMELVYDFYCDDFRIFGYEKTI